MGVTAATPCPSAGSEGLAPKLRGVQVGVRRDLQVARHLFRGQVTYTVRDPVSFETHAFSAADYALLVAINGERTLGETFQSLVTSGVVTPGDEEQFYAFIVSLHRGGLLALPISDDKSLYAKYERREASRRRGRWLAALYLKIPVWNPDAFLVRTLRAGAWPFSKPAVVLWSILMVAATIALAGRWRDIGADLPALLAGEQLLSMWVLLVGLKVVHEFGHAYACRRYGGAVPEMGISLVLLTPCAYVDASASWSFTCMRERIVVCLGGMYFESWIAAAAAIVWALTEQSAVHSIAYQTFVLASVTTIGFNMNPLMRFDGYFILSDLLQVPNLRTQATAYGLRLLKHRLVGVDPGGPSWSLPMRAALLTYAVASVAYRITVVLGMCAVIAIKFFAVGMVMGLVYGAATLIGTLLRCTRYLVLSRETAPVRVRAACLACALLIVPAAIVSIPLPRSLAMQAVVGRADEWMVTSLAPGEIVDLPMLEQPRATPDQTLVQLGSIDCEGALDEARAHVHAAKVALDIATTIDPTQEALARREYDAARVRLADAEREQAELSVRAPAAGEVLPVLRSTDLGRNLAAGTPVAIVASGDWVVRALVDQVDLASMHWDVGTPVELKVPGDSHRVLLGHVTAVAPAGSPTIDEDMHALTAMAGGDVPVSPTDATAPDARYEVTVAVDSPDAAGLFRGQRMALRLPGRPISLATGWYRALLRFRERLATAE